MKNIKLIKKARFKPINKMFERSGSEPLRKIWREDFIEKMKENDELWKWCSKVQNFEDGRQSHSEGYCLVRNKEIIATICTSFT